MPEKRERSEAQKRADKKYSTYYKENYTILGCRVKKEDAAEIKKVMAEHGIKPNAFFWDAIIEFMEKHGAADRLQKTRVQDNETELTPVDEGC